MLKTIPKPGWCPWRALDQSTQEVLQTSRVLFQKTSFGVRQVTGTSWGQRSKAGRRRENECRALSLFLSCAVSTTHLLLIAWLLSSPSPSFYQPPAPPCILVKSPSFSSCQWFYASSSQGMMVTYMHFRHKITSPAMFRQEDHSLTLLGRGTLQIPCRKSSKASPMIVFPGQAWLQWLNATSASIAFTSHSVVWCLCLSSLTTLQKMFIIWIIFFSIIQGPIQSTIIKRWLSPTTVIPISRVNHDAYFELYLTGGSVIPSTVLIRQVWFRCVPFLHLHSFRLWLQTIFSNMYYLFIKGKWKALLNSL